MEQQNDEGGDGDIGGEMPLPVKEHGQQKSRCHDQGPDNGGLHAGDQRIAEENGHDEDDGCFPGGGVDEHPGGAFHEPVDRGANSQGDEAHMQSGDGEQMDGPGCLVVFQGFRGQGGAVAGQDRHVETALPDGKTGAEKLIDPVADLLRVKTPLPPG